FEYSLRLFRILEYSDLLAINQQLDASRLSGDNRLHPEYGGFIVRYPLVNPFTAVSNLRFIHDHMYVWIFHDDLLLTFCDSLFNYCCVAHHTDFLSIHIYMEELH